MSRPTGFGQGFHPPGAEPSADRTEFILLQRPLQRILAFTRRSIDDVVNDPIAKREVLGYYKLHKQVERACEVVDLERWWNGA